MPKCVRFTCRNTSFVVLLVLIAALILGSCAKSPTPAMEVNQTEETIVEPAQTIIDQQPEKTEIPTEARSATPTEENTSTSTETAEASISACALITKEEAETALGSLVGEANEQNYPPLYGCDYRADDLNKVGISLVEFDDTEQASDAFQLELDMNHYPEVSGIGDRALRPEIMEISVLKGKYELSISLINDEDKETRFEKAKQLALLALDRLP